ncbi:MAG: T9SS type A sorting domain-containing protein [Lewinellaceae bacterium]|nr:T9SS type A sorting domain-containing protein [Saprospiraceae bacterium]MCB9337383.1 T9SS type A sorting domain-containing protein [Lewinellaceae bacterium]
MSASTGIDILNNIVNATNTGIYAAGNCSSSVLAGNKLQGSQVRGLHVLSGAQIGAQNCHTNRWEGTFSDVGYRCDGTASLSRFSANGSSNSVYLPTVSSPPSFVIDNTNCGVMLMVGPGNGNSNTLETAVLHTSPTIFPNPNKGNFTIELPNELSNGEGFKVSITDLSGKTVLTQNFEAGAFRENIDIGDVSPGIYMVQILSNGFRQTEKLIVTD